MEFVRLAEFPHGLDLQPLCAALAGHHIPYQLREEGGRTILYVAADSPLELAVELVGATTGGASGAGMGFAGHFQRTPVMVVCLALSVLGAAVVQWQFPLLHWLTFQDFALVDEVTIAFGTFSAALEQGHYWRVITPIFIHFGIFHLAFNGLWLWEFGRRIEARTGSLHFLSLVLVTGVVSNSAQYLWSGPSLFGGMSGVIYALLGYLWIRQKLDPSPDFALPRGIVGFMLAWLVICMTGAVGLVIEGNIANAAHASGLVAGMVIGALVGLRGAARGNS